MKINTLNLVATDALWTALANQADHRVSLQDTEVLKVLLPYQVYHCQYDSGKQRLLIMGNTKAYAVDRKVGVEEVTYEITSKGIMTDIVHDTLGFEKDGVIQSDCYLSGLIEFISNYRQPQGRNTRERIAEEEILSLAIKVDSDAFDEQLRAAESVLTAHSFYDQNNKNTDLQQLLDKPQPQIDPGVYAYASFNGKGNLDTLVFVSLTKHNIAIAHRDEAGRVIMRGNSALGDFLHEGKPRIANVLAALQNPHTVMSRVLDSEGVNPVHLLAEVSLRPEDMFHTTSAARDRMFGGSHHRRAVTAALFVANVLAATRDALKPVEVDEICPGCGGHH